MPRPGAFREATQGDGSAPAALRGSRSACTCVFREAIDVAPQKGQTSRSERGALARGAPSCRPASSPLGSPQCGWRAPSGFSLRNTLWDVAFHAIAVMTGQPGLPFRGPVEFTGDARSPFHPVLSRWGRGAPCVKRSLSAFRLWDSVCLRSSGRRGWKGWKRTIGQQMMVWERCDSGGEGVRHLLFFSGCFGGGGEAMGRN